MKKLFTTILTVILVAALLAGCSASENVEEHISPLPENNLAVSPRTTIAPSVDSEEIGEEGNTKVFLRSFDAIFEGEELLKLEGKAAEGEEFQEALYKRNENFTSANFSSFYNTQEEIEKFYDKLYELNYPFHEKLKFDGISFNTKRDEFFIDYVNSDGKHITFKILSDERKKEFTELYLSAAETIVIDNDTINAVYSNDELNTRKNLISYLLSVNDKLIVYTVAVPTNVEPLELLEEFEFVPFKEVLDSKREA